MKTHKLKDKVVYAIGKLKEAQYRYPVDPIELANGNSMVLVRILKTVSKQLPRALMEGYFGKRLEVMNPYSFVETTYKMMRSRGIEPELSVFQFFSHGFGLKKIDFILLFLDFCRNLSTEKSLENEKKHSPSKNVRPKVKNAENCDVIDYGQYIVQRHCSPKGKKIEPEMTKEEHQQLKKEELRNSLEKYEMLREQQNETGFSPILSSIKKEKEQEGMEKQVRELKEELCKLNSDFRDYKEQITESINGMKEYFEKIVHSPPREFAEEAYRDYQRTAKFEPIAEASPENLLNDLGEPRETPRDALPNSDLLCQEIEVKDSPVDYTLQEPITEEVRPDLDDYSEPKKGTMEFPHYSEENMLKTDEFILEQFKKMENAKDLLKSLNLPS